MTRSGGINTRTGGMWRLLAAVALSVGLSAAVSGPAHADSAPFSSCYSTNNQNCVTPWGYTGQRTWGYPVDAYGNNCTNYAAFRLSQSGYINPGNLGDASSWAVNARAKGLAVKAGSSRPVVGDVAQWNYGHVAYVEWVSGDGSQFAISETGWGPITLGTKTYPSMSGRGIFGGGGTHNESAWPDNFIHFNGGPVSGNPFGSLDSVSSPAVGLVRVGGWAADTDNKQGPLAVHVYANGKMLGQLTANLSRPDIPAAFPGYGGNLGYDGMMSANATGAVQVCTYAINQGAGDTNTQLGCKTVNVSSPNPFGYFDSAIASAPGTVKVRGWMADPNDRNGPIVVHFYANGVYAGKLTANKYRPDVATANPSYGKYLGFSGTLYPHVFGPVELCAFGINVGTGWDNTRVGCKTLTVANPNPFGNFDSATARGGRKVSVKGWAADPNDKNGPIKVKLYANGKYIKYAYTGKYRPDVRAANPGYGNYLGWSFSAYMPAKGLTTLCIKAVDKGAGWIDTELGCRQLTVT